MRSNSPSYGFLFAVFILLSLVAFVPGQTSPQSGKGAPSTAMHEAAGPSTDPSKYVGAETCKTCHEEIYNAGKKLRTGRPRWTRKAGHHTRAARGAMVRAPTM